MNLITTGIDHLNLDVIDLGESCKFWNELLGFEVLEEIPEQNGKIIGVKSALLALYERPGMQKYEKGGFAHVSFNIQNFNDIEERCRELGIGIKYGGAIQWPQSRSIYIEDPNGYDIELSEVWGGNLV